MAERDVDPVQTLAQLGESLRSLVGPTPDAIEQRVRSHSPSASRPWRHRPKRVVGLAVVAGVLALSGVAAAFWSAREPDRPESGTTCRSAASLSSHSYVLDVGVDPIQGCVELWQSGQYPEPDRPLSPGQTAPDLVACIGPGGVVEVFPGAPDTCAVLGLPQAELAPSAETTTVVELQTRVVRLNEGRCQSADALEAEIQDLLSELGLNVWTITLNPAAPGMTCPRAAVDSVAATVHISFVPDPFQPTNT